MKTHLFVIEMTTEAPLGELKHYINEALVYWGGQYMPEHPLFGLEPDNVKLRYLCQKKVSKKKSQQKN